jgi:hypothetical protein
MAKLLKYMVVHQNPDVSWDKVEETVPDPRNGKNILRQKKRRARRYFDEINLEFKYHNRLTLRSYKLIEETYPNAARLKLLGCLTA